MNHRGFYIVSGVLLFLGALTATQWNPSFRDQTSHEAYSVSSATLKVISQLKEPVTLKYFAPLKGSPHRSDFDYQVIRGYYLLHSFAKLSSDLIKLETFSTHKNLAHFEQGRQFGLRSFKGDHDETLWGLVLQQGSRQVVIPSFSVIEPEFFEFEVSSHLISLMSVTKPKLYLASPESMTGQHRDPRFLMDREWQLVRALKKYFEVLELDINTDSIPFDADIVLLYRPELFPKPLIDRFQEFLGRGGRGIILVDPFTREDFTTPVLEEDEKVSEDFLSLLDHWGVAYNPSLMVGNHNRAFEVQAVQGKMKYPFFLNLDKRDLPAHSKVLTAIRSVSYMEGGYFELLPREGISEEILLYSGKKSGFMAAEKANFLSTKELARSLTDDQPAQILAVLLRKKLQNQRQGMLALFADSDFVHDKHATEMVRKGEHVYLQPKNDNIALVVNAAEYLGGHEALLDIRNPSQLDSLLPRIYEFRRQVFSRYDEPMKLLQKDLQLISEERKVLLLKIQNGTHTPLTQETLTSLKNEEVILRKKLDQLKEKRKKYINWELLPFHLFFLGGAPVLVLLAYFWFVLRKVAWPTKA